MNYDDLKELTDAIVKYCNSVKCDNCLFGYDFGRSCTLRDVFPSLWEKKFIEVKGND